MKSTFAEIVKAQRIDHQGRHNRRFEAMALFELAKRSREGNLTALKVERNPFYRFWLFLKRVFGKVWKRVV